MNQSGLKLMLSGWLDGAVRSHAYIMGATSLKNFLRSAAEVFYYHFSEAAEDAGVLLSGATVYDIAESVSAAETSLGIMDAANLSVNREEEELVMHGCPYAAVCTNILSDLVESSQNQRNMPCFRAEFYLAACGVEAEEKNRYLLKQYAPGDYCTVKIMTLE
ncbi:MAG: hypothetical protein JW750_04225 [Anaerolineaceae bacterium]|nr:hypothetical protein [Anaerolineaceae bacterium]